MTSEASAPSVRVTAYVSLGSNQGDTGCILESARHALDALPGVRLGKVSSVYRTEPQGYLDQPFFANQVVLLECLDTVRPEVLLDMMLGVEASLGRVRRRTDLPDGPRPIDLDLLLFGNRRMDSRHIVLPHPRMLERAFVMVPLAEIASDLILPQGMTVREALAGIRYTVVRGLIYQNDIA